LINISLKFTQWDAIPLALFVEKYVKTLKRTLYSNLSLTGATKFYHKNAK